MPEKPKPQPVMVRFYPGEESNPVLIFLAEPGDQHGVECTIWQPIGEHGSASPYVFTTPEPGKFRARTYPATRAEAEKWLARYLRAGYPADCHPPEGYRVVMHEAPAYRKARMAEALRQRTAAREAA